MIEARDDFFYPHAEASCSDLYLWPPLHAAIEGHKFTERRAFDLGCGNGSTAGFLQNLGFKVLGVDISPSGIGVARKELPQQHFEVASAYDDLAGRFGRFPLVISLEVVEHCFDPKKFASTFFNLIEDGGIGILSTPYHGYLKNLALALSGKWDSHHSVMWDGGHIKFFSIPTLRQLLAEAGFVDIEFIRAGRIPPLAKSMIAIVRR
ncbi:MAG: methyltransferase domain-containing protein [Pseudolabrys sp.]